MGTKSWWGGRFGDSGLRGANSAFGNYFGSMGIAGDGRIYTNCLR